MKTSTVLLTLIYFVYNMMNAQVQRVEPPFWWSGMQHSKLQVLLYGKHIAQYNVTSDLPITEVKKTENPNYLFVTLATEGKAAGKYTLTLLKGRQSPTNSRRAVRVRQRAKALTAPMWSTC